MDNKAQDNGEVLIVEDDRDIRRLIADQMRLEGYRVRTAEGLSMARGCLEINIPDVLILDLTLPDGDGMTLCEELRQNAVDVEIIMLSARASPSDRVFGLEVGADDYLIKPFEPSELTARVRNLMRRSTDKKRPPIPRGSRFAFFGPWRLDLVKRRLLTPEGTIIALATAEYEILHRLIEAPHQCLTRDELLPERKETVWMDRSSDNRISRLRQKLAQLPAGEDLILTVRGQGYCLACDVTYN